MVQSNSFAASLSDDDEELMCATDLIGTNIDEVNVALENEPHVPNDCVQPRAHALGDVPLPITAAASSLLIPDDSLEQQQSVKEFGKGMRHKRPSIISLGAVLSGVEHRHVGWREAMKKEIFALEANKTWVMESLPPGRKALDVNGCIRLNITLMAQLSV
ncbi:hypothetical protein LIER_33644 [Lithospermum erythrorhizon]|uniref:Uncharacterized protein n=1 Tax=Lithospermum erythrorhizon TaxID=34254 RepID=A0AAV3S2X2_LITER